MISDHHVPATPELLATTNLSVSVKPCCVMYRLNMLLFKWSNEKMNYFRVVCYKMDCDVARVGVGDNKNLGEVQGVLGEEEAEQLKTQVTKLPQQLYVDCQ